MNIVPPTTQTVLSDHHRLDQFPTEMISIILGFCDPRTMVNIICTCKRLRVLSIQILLNGRSRQEYWAKGISIRHLCREEWMVDVLQLPNEILNCYLEFLMKEDELEEMKRLDLCCFANLGEKYMKNVVKFMNKFHIEELIMSHSNGVIDWVNRNYKDLKFLSKLSIVVLQKVWFSDELKFKPSIPLKVLQTLLSDNSEVENFCNSQYCSNFEELTIGTSEVDFGNAFVNILEKCTNLRVFDLRIIRSYNVNASYPLIKINDETLQILRNCKKLEVLRLDGYYDKYLNINKLVDDMDGIFPNLKTFECFFPVATDLCLVPKHELESIALRIPPNNARLPKCDTFYLNQASFIPEIDCKKLFLLDPSMVNLNKNLCELLSIIPELKELYLYHSNITYSQGAFISSNSYKLNIEKLWIRKGYFEVDILIHLIRNCPNLKELYLENVKITNSLATIFDSQELNESKLRVFHFKSCSLNYPLLIEQLTKDFTFPYLDSIVLENAYSITKEILSSLLERVKTLSTLNISGVEFDNELIEKYLVLKKNNIESELSFNGKGITLEYVKNLDVIKGLTAFSLPDCILDNDEMIQVLDLIGRDKLLKIQINLGKSGPTIELFKKLQEFTSLQMIYLVGKPEQKIEGLEEFILDDFLISMPSIRLLYLESGEFKREAIEITKGVIRSLGKSAPKLLVPMERGPYPFKVKEKQETGSWCQLM
ncbi:hypothetical protein NAEGRDRAFT_51198 [Naegleria gruberi]|uniref:F-box domain-containing protein n=1 Tax=Naegleria gruberi TaxID=5762 RepID=D2VPC9_NAEGR|nr:uncharacterized protein NAEGRDRAFT_51198 [Naegleria gruberi]EFC41336.1 hypothetical protein NAEGRDRAFT_51198 [Naegleria gruberi]|eukprot:XP_002674080.1 hypothetical protein NAEGRDRAFT_51198 [Naegleria gruberi strain NEG-M]